jgi:hypothetical protein
VLVTDPEESVLLELVPLELLELEEEIELAREFVGWPLTSTKTVVGMVVDCSVI